MPSYVAFTRTGRLIGQAAKNQASVNPRNTISDALRFVGFRFRDPYIQAMIKRMPFTVTHDLDDKPFFEVMYKNIPTTFTPVEVQAMIVKRAKKDAEKYLNHPIADALVTTPAHFNISQRLAIKDALSIAGINALGISHAPTFALAASDMMPRERNVLVCDIGAGYYDVVLAIVSDGIVEVRAVAGGVDCVGYDYDTRLMNHMINCFFRAEKTDFGEEKNDPYLNKLDLNNGPRALRCLRIACNKAKHQLSSA
ncbi:heat shock protein 70, partial [Periconia macrospinosa]